MAALRTDAVANDRRSSHFRYPSEQGQGFDYLRREVKLNWGAHGPAAHRALPGEALLAESYPTLFADWRAR